MTCDKEKLQNMIEYKEGRVVVTTNNLRLPITHVSNTVLALRYSPQKVALQDVYYVSCMKKNLLSVS